MSPDVDGDLLNAELVVQTAQHAIRDYDDNAYNKARSLQTLVYRLTDHGRQYRGS